MSETYCRQSTLQSSCRRTSMLGYQHKSKAECCTSSRIDELNYQQTKKGIHRTVHRCGWLQMRMSQWDKCAHSHRWSNRHIHLGLRDREAHTSESGCFWTQEVRSYRWIRTCICGYRPIDPSDIFLHKVGLKDQRSIRYLWMYHRNSRFKPHRLFRCDGRTLWE